MADDSALVSGGLGAIGGTLGGIYGGPMGASAGAGIGMSLGGLITGGSAASKAAKAQQDQARRYEQWIQGKTDQAMALMTNPAQMAAHDQALQAQEHVVRQQEQLAQTMAPNLVNIGKQLGQLMQGQSAPVLQNLQQQRDRQKSQLQDHLNAQLGPGGASSSAGIQAMSNFDNETANMMSSAQQSYMGQFMSASLQSPSVMNALGGANVDLANINANSPQAQAARMLGSMTGMGQNAQQNLVQTAGGQYIGQQLQGQAMGQVGSGLMSLGAAMYGKNSLSPTKPSDGTSGAVVGDGAGGAMGGGNYMAGGGAFGGVYGNMPGLQASGGNVGSGTLGSTMMPQPQSYASNITNAGFNNYNGMAGIPNMQMQGSGAGLMR